MVRILSGAPNFSILSPLCRPYFGRLAPQLMMQQATRDRNAQTHRHSADSICNLMGRTTIAANTPSFQPSVPGPGEEHFCPWASQGRKPSAPITCPFNRGSLCNMATLGGLTRFENLLSSNSAVSKRTSAEHYRCRQGVFRHRPRAKGSKQQVKASAETHCMGNSSGYEADKSAIDRTGAAM